MIFYPWHQSQWQQALARIEAQRIPTAWLLAGMAGLGQELFAEQLMARLLCLNPSDAACGQCRSCQLLKAKAHPDVATIEVQDGSKAIRIDQIRSILEFARQASSLGKYQIVYIKSAESMNTAASNALLKILEDPAPGTLFILTCNAVHRLLPTVKSRCVQLPFSPPDKLTASQWLLEQNVTESEIDFLLALSGGAPLAACEHQTAGLFGLWQTFLQDLSGLQQGKYSAVTVAQRWLAGAPLLTWLRFWLLACENELRQRLDVSSQSFLWWRQLLQAYERCARGVNLQPQLWLEALVVKWLQKKASPDEGPAAFSNL